MKSGPAPLMPFRMVKLGGSTIRLTSVRHRLEAAPGGSFSPAYIGISFHPRLAMVPSVSHNLIVGRG
jgi:hypothetical protein